jgi:hypothetical protein
VASLHFTPDANDGYQKICTDPALEFLWARIDEILDLLEKDPGDARVRKHRFHQANLWAVYVTHRNERWAVLWGADRHNPGDVAVAYIGPATFV